MIDRDDIHGEGRGHQAPSSPGGRTPGAGPAGPAPAAGAGEVDDELIADLGAEYELRGDVLEDEVEAARAEAAEWRDKGMRAQAEFENTKRRLETRHADALLRAGERIITELLPVLDDLDLAIGHATGDGSDVAEGLSAVRRKLLDVIGKEGASVIDPFGEPFDPERHNAVQMREDPGVADQTVVDVFQKGYEMHGRVLRAAMVVVSTGGPSSG
jgi:molecular chaperone GrpE